MAAMVTTNAEPLLDYCGVGGGVIVGGRGVTVREEEHSDDDEEEYGDEDHVEIDADERLVPTPRAWFEDEESSRDHSCVPRTTREGCSFSAAPSHDFRPPTSTTSTTRESMALKSSMYSCSSTSVMSPIHVDEYIDAGDQNDFLTRPPPLRRSSSSPPPCVGAPSASPGWREISSQVLPAAARELLASSVRRVCHTARLSYAHSRWHRRYRDLGNNAGGYDRSEVSENVRLPSHFPDLPPFSSLPWVDRQLVREWRTYLQLEEGGSGGLGDDGDNPDCCEETDDFDRARAVVPMPASRPLWQKSEVCHACYKPFGPVRLRHHCRLCGGSFCHAHSSGEHKLPHLGYDPDVPERVCDWCKRCLLEQNLAERVAWRLARCRDHVAGSLTPYFETGVDTVEEAALRVTRAALSMARSIPLGAQATVAVETVDVLRRHGFNGLYTVMLRKEFLAAADLLRKACGIDAAAWPLSVHELSAAIFYALAQHRAVRGMRPEREHLIHSFRGGGGSGGVSPFSTGHPAPPSHPLGVEEFVSPSAPPQQLPFDPVCDPVPDTTLASLIFYAPIALNFIYVEKEVDIQLLAAQQGWRLLYAYLDQEEKRELKDSDRPASALFVHEEQKTVCLAIRGTATIHDVVTDIRQVPVPFPETPGADAGAGVGAAGSHHTAEDDWMAVFRGQGIAVCGMAGAATNLYQEHIDAIMFFARRGYRVRLTGHSLGGGVATLLGLLIYRDLKRESAGSLGGGGQNQDKHNDKKYTATDEQRLRVYAYGTPSCVDARLAEFVESFVTTVVLHDDVVPRLTPTSCRALLKHLLHIRETWVKAHLPDDLVAITERARAAWAPRWREGFTLAASRSSSSIQRYCRKQIQYGTRKLLSVKCKLVGDAVKGSEGLGGGRGWESGCGRGVEGNQVPAQPHDDPSAERVEREPRFLLDCMGEADNRSEVLLIDGDEFFDADKDLLVHESDEESYGASFYADAMDFSSGYASHNAPSKERLFTEGDSFSSIYQSQMTGSSSSSPSARPHSFGGNSIDQESTGAVVLEETPLPLMFIPGRIVHIYAHRGVYRAAYVPRSFRELRRISLAGNMLSDHKCKAYYEGLLEVRSVRAAEEDPPRWTPFDENDTCSCCASRFTWASTSDSKAQEARDKHNCRSCGTLVCDPCSKNRIPLPSIGLAVTSRVCDRCYNDIEGISTCRPLGMTDSFSAAVPRPAVAGPEAAPAPRTSPGRPERQRDRRSAVVDELASRVQTSPD